jgi:putative endopeptidase
MEGLGELAGLAPAELSLADLAPEIRPQDDLFRHVNQNWLTHHEIPPDRSVDGAIWRLGEISEQRVRDIIEDCAAKGENAATANGKVGALYASFLDTAQLEKLGLEPIRGELAEIAQTSDMIALSAVLGKMQRAGVSGLFHCDAEFDAHNPNRYLLAFAQAGIGLPDESYYRDSAYQGIRDEYAKHIARMLALGGIGGEFGVSYKSAAEYAAAAQRVFDLERKLAAGHWDVVSSKDVIKTDNPMSFTQLVELAPEFPLANWAAAYGLQTDDLAQVVIFQSSYLTHLAKLWQEIPLADWKLLFAYRLVNARARYLTNDLVQQWHHFYYGVLSGISEIPQRWKRGVALVERALGEVVGQEYVRRHFSEMHQGEVAKIIENVISAYREAITNLDWLSEATKNKALAKLDKLHVKLGHPTKWQDYSALTISENDLLGNVRAIAEFHTNRELAKLSQPVDPEEWPILPQEVNGWYVAERNEMIFTVALLQPPLFGPAADAAYNYAGIGENIGHEISHAFDDQGSQYDGDGKLIEWWASSDRAEFSARAKKLSEQYSTYVPQQLGPNGPTVNGELTLGENIADVSGLAVAISAYRIHLANQALESGNPIPPDVDLLDTAPIIAGYSGIQRLFLNWAKCWQDNWRDEELLELIATDEHAPSEFRCNGVVRNLPEFYQAFSVSCGDKLYLDPKDRVTFY